ncbi:ATP-binding protein [Sphingomonas mesophila]|uniref:sensor histidine kinase n=1 Tax=Sphingomonas mesophila TaxID=2303576 RepID=UPI0013C2A0CB|nr:ATP-binding protein [Sphingomonas mesophila]
MSHSALGWLARERSSGRFYRFATIFLAALLMVMIALSVSVLIGGNEPQEFLSPPLIALLLVSILIPAIALMVLFSRRLAMARAEQRGLAGGRLHTRLVALFSVVAAVPTVLVAIFASLLFQSGLEFWFSDRARGLVENSVQLVRGVYDAEVERVAAETTTMSGDVATYLGQVPLQSREFQQAFGQQVLMRNLSEAIIFNVNDKGEILSLALVNPYDRPLNQVIKPEHLRALGKSAVTPINSSDRIGALTKLNYGPDTYMYASRVFDPEFATQLANGSRLLTDYKGLIERSRLYQLRFNGALLLGALAIVALAIFFALKIADRLVRPVGELVGAVERVEAGDFSVRVPVHQPRDEIAILASAFNRMTGRLQEQTGALVSANEQLDTRRAFIEAVLSSVTAGVIALDQSCRILLVNRSAQTLLRPDGADIEGQSLADVSGDLAEFMSGEARDANVVVAAGSGQRTLAVKRVRYADGAVLTFDDITDQLSDQRRAAWSDIARRIAHEIKNPLTPIQLAAERLQRRYGEEVKSDRETFERLTGTIVRQVGDLRRMVDEFSNFARMPKPVFQSENVHEIARAALFLHEVAHPGISFSIDPPSARIAMVCDRRQLSQALTNVVKNAVEAIEVRRNRGESRPEGDRVDLKVRRDGDQVVVDVTDTGVGLPEERERLTEPYMTTRVRGTGLGLAIVKKIVEEHLGEIAFLDRAGGGTHVRIAFDADRLEALAGEADEVRADGPLAEDGEYDEEGSA